MLTAMQTKTKQPTKTKPKLPVRSGVRAGFVDGGITASDDWETPIA